MKFIKSAAFACSVALATGAFADAGNTLITFSTQADTYADGTPVKDGEWYALCWSPNETCKITADSEPATAGDKIYLLAPLAKNGRCPTTVFQLDSKVAPTTGNYFVYMLDTRIASSDPEVADKPAKAGDDGKPTATRGQKLVVMGSAVEKDSIIVGTEEPSNVVFSPTDDPKDVPPPVITAFDPHGDRVRITVTGMHPALQYNVRAGKTISEIKTLGAEPVQGDVDKVTFDVDKDLGNFFKVVRQPLTTQE